MPAVPAASADPGPDPSSVPGSGVPGGGQPPLAVPTGPGSGVPGFGLDERASLALCVADPSPFDAGTVLDLLVRVDAEQSRWAAARVRLLAELSARDVSADRWVAEEVGSALRLSPARAMAEVNNAVQLHDRLPRMFGELAAGRVSPGQARLVAEASYRLPADGGAVTVLDEAAASRCGELSEPQTRALLRRQVLRADPAGAARRHRRAVTDRQVRLVEAEDGMAVLTALLPAPQAVACMQVLDTAARRHRATTRARTEAGTGDTDSRTLDQLRADLLTHTLLGAGSVASADTAAPAAAAGPDGAIPGPGRTTLAPTVNVIVSASTLLGQDDEPGWLDRYGPITADTARHLAHDPTGTWRRLITDPTTGQPVDVGTRRYRPPAPLRRHIEVRDGTCRFPYCTHPATHCDLDHAVPYPEGPTAAGNLHAVSRRHHRAKTHTPWKVHIDPDTGHTTWTSPLGRTRTTRPPQRWTHPNDTPAQLGADDGCCGDQTCAEASGGCCGRCSTESVEPDRASVPGYDADDPGPDDPSGSDPGPGASDPGANDPGPDNPAASDPSGHDPPF